MNLIKYTPLNPFQELDQMERELDRAFGATSAQWAPSVDVVEEEDAFVVKADLPGMSKEDIHVEVENDLLTISGERKFQHQSKTAKGMRCERLHGAFSRSMTLPDSVDAGKVTAEYSDGVLSLRLPKREEAKPRSISVKVA